MISSIGVIGKARLTPRERQLLIQLGRVIALAGKTLVIVPAPGTAEAVEMGVKLEDGPVARLGTGVVSTSAHVFIYADARLMARLRDANPSIDNDPQVTLLSSPIEIEMWLDAAAAVLRKRGIIIK